MNVIIRELQPEDVEVVSQIETASFSMPWSAESFLEMISAEHCLYLVAEVDRRVVGCCGLIMVCDEANISNVVVDESMRGKGIGQALFSEIILQGQARDITDFSLEVRVSNQIAIHIYQKFGFESEGIRPKFYEKPEEDAMIMWRHNVVV